MELIFDLSPLVSFITNTSAAMGNANSSWYNKLYIDEVS